MEENEFVFKEEFVEINGLSHFFLHYDHKKSITLIHLHGGPGSSAILFSHLLNERNDFCNLVYYDQRGTGRTLYKSKTKPSELTLEQMLSDLSEVIKYVKKEYSDTKIVLLGHSWGTVLGSEYILRYPGDVDAYIGYGQVVNVMEGESIAYQKIIDIAEHLQDDSLINKLNKIGDYPYNVDQKKIFKKYLEVDKLKKRVGFVATTQMFQLASQSPIFKIHDLMSMMNGPKMNRKLFMWLSTYDLSNEKDYKVPMFYILGQLDYQVPSIVAKRYFDTIRSPKKALYWIDEAAHNPDVEQPDKFAETLRVIIRSL